MKEAVNTIVVVFIIMPSIAASYTLLPVVLVGLSYSKNGSPLLRAVLCTVGIFWIVGLTKFFQSDAVGWWSDFVFFIVTYLLLPVIGFGVIRNGLFEDINKFVNNLKDDASANSATPGQNSDFQGEYKQGNANSSDNKSDNYESKSNKYHYDYRSYGSSNQYKNRSFSWNESEQSESSHKKTDDNSSKKDSRSGESQHTNSGAGKNNSNKFDERYDEYFKNKQQNNADKEEKCNEKNQDRANADYENRFKNMTISDAYNILGVPASASDENIKRIWRNLAAVWHPDSGATKDDTHFKLLGQAYDIVKKHRNMK